MIGWLVVLNYSVSIIFRSFNVKLNFKQLKYSFCLQTVKYQNSSIQFGSSTYFSSIYKTVLFQVIQFSIST